MDVNCNFTGVQRHVHAGLVYVSSNETDSCTMYPPVTRLACCLSCLASLSIRDSVPTAARPADAQLYYL